MKFDRDQPELTSNPRAGLGAGRRTRSVWRWLGIAAAAWLWAWSAVGAAALEVEATLSAPAVELGTPVTLSLSAISDTAAPSLPDLGPLETDFSLIDRRIERQTSITNGVRRDRLRLRLLLLPRRTGTLEIPALALGDTALPPLTLVVLEAPARPTESSTVGPQTPPGVMPATPAPFVPPWPGPAPWASGALPPVPPEPPDLGPSTDARTEPRPRGSAPIPGSGSAWRWGLRSFGLSTPAAAGAAIAGPVRDLERAFFSPVPLAWAAAWSETLAAGLTSTAATRADAEHT